MMDSLRIPEAPLKKRRISIRYKTDGTAIKAHIRASLYLAMVDVKNLLESATQLDFSQSILVRRALDLYLREIPKMTRGQLQNEAAKLASQYR